MIPGMFVTLTLQLAPDNRTIRIVIYAREYVCEIRPRTMKNLYPPVLPGGGITRLDLHYCLPGESATS